MHLDTKKLGFAARLTQAMEERGLNQVQLAGMVRVAQSQVSNWKKGKTMPHPRVAEELAYHLYLNTEWLLEGTGPKTPEDKSRYQLKTAAKIADKAKSLGFSPAQTQSVFEISESIIREGTAGYGTDWQARAVEAETRALEAERKLEDLKSQLEKMLNQF